MRQWRRRSETATACRNWRWEVFKVSIPTRWKRTVSSTLCCKLVWRPRSTGAKRTPGSSTGSNTVKARLIRRHHRHPQISAIFLLHLTTVWLRLRMTHPDRAVMPTTSYQTKVPQTKWRTLFRICCHRPWLKMVQSRDNPFYSLSKCFNDALIKIVRKVLDEKYQLSTEF